MSIVEPEVAESTGGDAPQTSVKSPEPSYQQLSQAQESINETIGLV